MLSIAKLEVKDEILSQEPLYEIKDSTGKVVATNCTIELITSLLAEGTPVNKVLFDKIDSNFENIRRNDMGKSIAFFEKYKMLIF